MPIISSINLARRIVKEEASIYRESPKRGFVDMSEAQVEAMFEMYDDYGFNDNFAKANQYFKLQQQVHVQWTLCDGEIKPRVLLPHHLDVIPRPNDPEKGDVYIISSFDKMTVGGLMGTDGINMTIADANDSKDDSKRYIVWTKDLNFIMNADGEVLSVDMEGRPSMENPIEILPIVDISSSKDFEYWVRQGQSVTDFSVQFNAMLSDVANVVRLQGWGQAVFTGAEGIMPESLQIGPNHVLRLPQDPNNPIPTTFQYVTPNADIAGSLNYLKMTLSMFLSSRGIDPKVITLDGAGESFSSGLERLLSMVAEFEASKDDMDVFYKAEMQSFKIIKAYINTYSGTDLLNSTIGTLPDDSYMTLEYKEPQMIKSESEMLDLLQKKMDMGLLSQLEAYIELHGVDEATALKALKEINGETTGTGTF